MRPPRRLGLAAAAVVVAWAVALPAAAHAQGDDPYPSDVEPPSWFWETLGPPVVGPDGATHSVDCVRKSYFEESMLSNGDVEDTYGYTWQPAAVPPLTEGDCTRYWGAAVVRCFAEASNTPGGEPAHTFNYSCGVFTPGKAEEFKCGRGYQLWTYEDGSVQHLRDKGWIPNDCRSSLEGWPDRPGTSAADYQACERAREKVEKAKKKLQQADSPAAKQAAKRKLRKAKRNEKEAC